MRKTVESNPKTKNQNLASKPPSYLPISFLVEIISTPKFPRKLKRLKLHVIWRFTHGGQRGPIPRPLYLIPPFWHFTISKICSFQSKSLVKYSKYGSSQTMDTISLLSRDSGQGRKETNLRFPHGGSGVKTLRHFGFWHLCKD